MGITAMQCVPDEPWSKRHGATQMLLKFSKRSSIVVRQSDREDCPASSVSMLWHGDHLIRCALSKKDLPFCFVAAFFTRACNLDAPLQRSYRCLLVLQCWPKYRIVTVVVLVHLLPADLLLWHSLSSSC